MVERSLSMREVPGSIPGFSTQDFFSLFFIHIHNYYNVHTLNFFQRHKVMGNSLPFLHNEVDVPQSNKLDLWLSRQQSHYNNIYWREK